MASAQALELASEHREVLNGISTLSQQEVLAFIQDSQSLAPSDLDGALKDGIPEIVFPYTQVAADVSADYYGMARELAMAETGLTYAEYSTVAPTTLPLTAGRMYAGINTGALALAGGQLVEIGQLIQFFGGLAQKSIYSGSRETFEENGKRDDSFKMIARVVRPGACAWCKFMTIETTANVQFHSFCRCVTGGIFQGETNSKYRQPFNEKFDADYEKAKNMIIDGTAGATEKSLKIGTQEYGKSVQRELTTKARDWRKGFEKSAGLNAEDRRIRRLRTNDEVVRLSEKINRSETLDVRDKQILSSWGVDEKSVLPTKLGGTGRKKAMDDYNPGDVLSVMRRELGYN